MEHAKGAALDELEPLFTAIRKRDRVTERRPGYFYRKGKALAHFHQDPLGLYADLHAGAEWHRYRVSASAERKRFLAALDKVVGAGT